MHVKVEASIMDQIVKEFLSESRENLDRVDRELARLEADPAPKKLPDLVFPDLVFRTIHTIKGTCGFLGFPHLGKVTHAAEKLLLQLRDGEISQSAETTCALQAVVQAVRDMLTQIESTGEDGRSDYTALLEILKRLQNGSGQDS
jgi:two-component system chemotaxis sensor kinase CheA